MNTECIIIILLLKYFGHYDAFIRVICTQRTHRHHRGATSH